ncbi:hypothetical protein LCGC14_1438660 [marine sediment metagenome]|uniref:Uncharacterized protein n=1 Tax=marine sediment metagenome TaxID=412755 RepID=A0A0F9K7I0_9ZZZZ
MTKQGRCEMCGEDAIEHYRWELRHPDSKAKYVFCSVLCVGRWAKKQLEGMCVEL